jgi:Gas vesicle synthesis protein GvpL/GvpF
VAEQLVWAYCVADADAELPAADGVDGRHPVERVSAAGLSALVSRVPESEFGPDALRRNLNEMDWLERVARAHEQVLEQALSATTIVPIRLCTLYGSEDGVRRMLEQEQAALSSALGALAGREEWGVKLLVDPVKVQQLAEAHALDAAADTLRAGLKETVLDLVTRPPQNPELSGLQGRMILNAAVLVEGEAVDRLRALAAGIEVDYAGLGARVIVTGPWPPYNFVPGSDAEAVA